MVVSKVGKNLERREGMASGDGVRDTTLYFEDHGVVVDAIGRDAGKHALLVRGLDARNAPTELFRVNKDGTVTVTGVDVLAQAGASGNLLTNGGMEIWQRGTGPFTADTAYTADRWVIGLNGGSTLSVSRDTADVGLGSLYAAAFVYTHSGGDFATLSQSIEGYEQLRGKTVTFQALVQASVAGTVKLRVFDGATNYDSAYNTGTGLETLSVTVDVPTGATGLTVRFRFDVASSGGKLDNVALTVGSHAADWRPMTPADDLARAQRYFWELGGLSTTEFVGVFQAISTTQAVGVLLFPVEMAVAPTLTVSAAADWSVFDAAANALACTALVAGTVTRRTARLTATVASGLVAGNASVMRASITAAARLTFVANP